MAGSAGHLAEAVAPRRAEPVPSRVMSLVRSPLLLLLLAVPAILLAPTPSSAQRYVATGDTLRPRIKYADSLVSGNDRCMVALQKLNRRVRPVYVNGVPMGFC